MLGTIVNALAILIGGIVGLLFKNGIPEKIGNTIMHGISLCIIYIGITGTLKGDNVLLIIMSIVIGGLIGELLDIDKGINTIGNKLEKRFGNKSSKGKSFSEGFVTTSLLFCVGAMAILGSLESGLQGNHEILYTKSVMDGISSIIFASSLGIGVIFSSISVFLYQGTITLSASLLKGVLITSVTNNITAVGSLLIMGLGFNILGATKIKVANLLPAIFIPIIYHIIVQLF